MPQESFTLEQLQKMGAQPQSYTLEELQAMGAKPEGAIDPQFADVQGGTSTAEAPIVQKPWYSQMFDEAQQGARNVVEGMGSIVTGIPGQIKAKGNEMTDSFTSPEKFLKGVLPGGALSPTSGTNLDTLKSVAQPVMTSAKGLGAYFGLNEAPTDEEFAQAQKGAGSNFSGLLTAKAAPAAGNLFNKIKGKLPANITPPQVNHWMGVDANDVLHGADPGAQLIKEGLLAKDKVSTLAKVEPALKQAGDVLGDDLKKAGQAGVVIDAEKTVFDALVNATKRIGKRTDKAFQTQLSNILDDILQDYPNLKNITPEEAHSLKVDIGDSTLWKGSAYEADLNKVMREMYGGLNKEIKVKVPTAAANQERWGNLYQSSKDLKKGMARDKVGSGTGTATPTRTRKAARTFAKGAATAAGGALVYKALAD